VGEIQQKRAEVAPGLSIAGFEQVSPRCQVSRHMFDWHKCSSVSFGTYCINIRSACLFHVALKNLSITASARSKASRSEMTGELVRVCVCVCELVSL
jgi:hypothetical protein